LKRATICGIAVIFTSRAPMKPGGAADDEPRKRD